MTTTPTPRPVPTQEDRMRDATTGPVHPAVQRVLAEHAHHIQPRDPNRPAPTFRTYLDEQERDQLDARAAAAEAERDDALNDRDAYREARDVLRKQLDAMKAAKKRALGRLEKAEHVIDLIRGGQEQIDRALAVYDTTPESTPTPGLGSPADRAQEPTPGDARRLLDQAIDTALPLAGLRVAELLDALRRELARVDAGRAPAEEPRVAPFGCDDCSVEHGERHRYADCPTNLRQIERDAARDARP